MYKHISGRPHCLSVLPHGPRRTAAASCRPELRCSGSRGKSCRDCFRSPRTPLCFLTFFPHQIASERLRVPTPTTSTTTSSSPFFSVCCYVCCLFFRVPGMIRCFRCNDHSVRVGDIMACSDHRSRLCPPTPGGPFTPTPADFHRTQANTASGSSGHLLIHPRSLERFFKNPQLLSHLCFVLFFFVFFFRVGGVLNDAISTIWPEIC